MPMPHNIRASIVSLLVVLCGLISYAGAEEHSDSNDGVHDVTVIIGANVVSMTEDRVLKNRTVLIQSGRIVSVMPAAAAHIPSNAKEIYAEGKFLIPGLMDMHIHLGFPDGYAEIPPKLSEKITHDELFLYLASGVTTVRNMRGDAYHLRLRDKLASGEILGPRFHTAGPMVDGDPPVWPAGYEILVAGLDVKRFVSDYKDKGYDFLKTYSNLAPDVYKELLDEAQSAGIRAVGHVGTQADIGSAIEHNKSSIEHLTGYDRVMQPEGAGPLPAGPYSGWPSIDQDLMPLWAQKTASANVAVCPTLVTLKHLGSEFGDGAELSQVLSRPGMEFISPLRKQFWLHSPFFSESWSETREMLRAGQANRERMVKELFQAGAPVLAGTDASSGFVMPGFDLATELEQFVLAGLSPFAALAAATVVPAHYLRQESELGVIRSGAYADMVLLKDDPTKDISAVRGVVGVMSKGRWFSQKEIAAKLQEIRVYNESIQDNF
ncbi:MAG: amidohydrolase family protein [Gammaproteobacteria bacterium]|nr:amidohydrolase family protein [Gammaproteobacteria bacterium]